MSRSLIRSLVRVAAAAAAAAAVANIDAAHATRRAHIFHTQVAR